MATMHLKRNVFQINEFTEFMILKNFSKRTIKSYTQMVLQFVEWWQGVPRPPVMSDGLD